MEQLNVMKKALLSLSILSIMILVLGSYTIQADNTQNTAVTAIEKNSIKISNALTLTPLLILAVLLYSQDARDIAFNAWIQAKLVTLRMAAKIAFTKKQKEKIYALIAEIEDLNSKRSTLEFDWNKFKAIVKEFVEAKRCVGAIFNVIEIFADNEKSLSTLK